MLNTFNIGLAKSADDKIVQEFLSTNLCLTFEDLFLPYNRNDLVDKPNDSDSIKARGQRAKIT